MNLLLLLSLDRSVTGRRPFPALATLAGPTHPDTKVFWIFRGRRNPKTKIFSFSQIQNQLFQIQHFPVKMQQRSRWGIQMTDVTFKHNSLAPNGSHLQPCLTVNVIQLIKWLFCWQRHKRPTTSKRAKRWIQRENSQPLVDSHERTRLPSSGEVWNVKKGEAAESVSTERSRDEMYGNYRTLPWQKWCSSFLVFLFASFEWTSKRQMDGDHGIIKSRRGTTKVWLWWWPSLPPYCCCICQWAVCWLRTSTTPANTIPEQTKSHLFKNARVMPTIQLAKPTCDNIKTPKQRKQRKQRHWTRSNIWSTSAPQN